MLYTLQRIPKEQGELQVEFSFSTSLKFKGIFSVVGASSDPCSEIYAGPSPFSEIEAKSLADLMSQDPKLLVHFAFHSKGLKLPLPAL
jgi:hypothetical protein